MQYLGVPVDHRLRRFIRSWERPSSTKIPSSHVETLYNLAVGLRTYRDKPVPPDEINFALDLAKPATIGGLVICLLQPRHGQKYSNSFAANVKDCATLEALRDVSSMFGLSLDEVSVFDAFPFITEEKLQRENKEHTLSHDAFQNMIQQKQPQVVLCCWQLPTSFASHIGMLVKSDGIGRQWPSKSILIGEQWSVIRVNSFHPSFSINRNPSESCFRELFILEFAKALGHWSGGWGEEKDWMAELRSSCLEKAKTQAKVVKRGTNLTFLAERYEETLQGLHGFLEHRDYLRNYSPQLLACPTSIYEDITNNCLMRLCCDASLALKSILKTLNSNKTLPKSSQTPEDEVKQCKLKVKQLSLEFFQLCAQGFWRLSPEKLVPDFANNQAGFYEHHRFIREVWTRGDGLPRYLGSYLITFLTDANLVFQPTSSSAYEIDFVALSDAFMRFAQGIEDALYQSLIIDPGYPGLGKVLNELESLVI